VPLVAEVGVVVPRAEPEAHSGSGPDREGAQPPGAPASADTPGPALAARSTPASASASAPLALPPVAHTRPVDVAPRPGRIALPALGQIIPEEARAQARAARRAREGDQPTAAAAPAGPAAASPPHEPAWAISTRPLRTRTEAEQVLAAMDGLLRPLGTPAVRIEILPEGDDWRVVGWPYTERSEAERALAVLLARGMRVQVIGF
jgi:hypothetical protein